ncbi:MAG: ATP synthase F1 subunit gamma [Candidatus Doudnabacteria bacterium CG10_big_fil_rev_8_21_14_0_10_42_18]|uniref:ATP synthase gamma chain n=1 Tax=Candidatus Doudnabacteria bacterium CG10_big_fil_rev_8_21_14_0_10_42_18 TaxID=1974552 RepID=A0A2H0VAT4_9BACT|nr:MAG: ATP synthase F1 subunit gamma [Candidatus Doudnabacteria bacterium CG10_big_fil_rev_8_21_14_0_10_42_18]
MPGTKELTNRIKSIKSTRKITRAMQLVSAAKMRKAQGAGVNSRAYAGQAWQLIQNLAQTLEIETDLFKTYPKAKKIGVLLLSTNKGLVGSLNLNLQAKIKELASEPEVISEIITYGKKGRQISVRLKQNVVADYEKQEKTLEVEGIYAISKFITEAYKTGQYKEIAIVYNHFLSTLRQKSIIKRLLPFSESLLQSAKEEMPYSIKEGYDYNYVFEPAPKNVLENLLPRIIESQIYQAILESNASEHSARMIMMKNATEAAGDLIADLTLTYNKIRQDKITTELAEITAGKIALE